MMKELSSEELLNTGIKLLEEEKHRDALAAINMAIKNGGYENVEEIPPHFLSYLGLITAIVEKRYRDGATLCKQAIKREFYNPVFYLNLGKVYVAGGYKHKAINSFYNGLKIDGTDDEIITELKKMGVRRKPTIPFLTRANLLNKYLGYLFHTMERA